MQPDRPELQPLASTRVYFTGQVAPSKGSGSTRQLGGTWALCLSPIKINGRDFQQDHMHMWVNLPFSVIQAANGQPQMKVRGFATVALYKRKAGSIAYGLNQASDLEIQTSPDADWRPPQSPEALRPAASRPVPSTYAKIPAATREHHHKAWINSYATHLKTAEIKVVVYQKTQKHPHDTQFQAVINRMNLILQEGNLPCAEDVNVVHYLIGAWASGQAPRHLKAVFETQSPVNAI